MWSVMGLFTLQNEFYLIFVFALESTPLVNKDKSGYDIGAKLNMLPLPLIGYKGLKYLQNRGEGGGGKVIPLHLQFHRF